MRIEREDHRRCAVPGGAARQRGDHALMPAMYGVEIANRDEAVPALSDMVDTATDVHSDSCALARSHPVFLQFVVIKFDPQSGQGRDLEASVGVDLKSRRRDVF